MPFDNLSRSVSAARVKSSSNWSIIIMRFKSSFSIIDLSFIIKWGKVSVKANSSIRIFDTLFSFNVLINSSRILLIGSSKHLTDIVTKPSFLNVGIKPALTKDVLPVPDSPKSPTMLYLLILFMSSSISTFRPKKNS